MRGEFCLHFFYTFYKMFANRAVSKKISSWRFYQFSGVAKALCSFLPTLKNFSEIFLNSQAKFFQPSPSYAFFNKTNLSRPNLALSLWFWGNIFGNYINNLIGFDDDLTLCRFSAALPWQLGFQSPSTSTMSKIIDLHNDLMFVLILIVLYVGALIALICWKFNSEGGRTISRSFQHHSRVEQIWTANDASAYWQTVVLNLRL